MDFIFKSLGKSPDQEDQQNKDTALTSHLKQRTFTIDSNLQKEQSEIKSEVKKQQIFLPIISLLNIAKNKQSSQKGINFSFLNDSNPSQNNIIQKTRNIDPSIDNQFLFKNLLEQHTLTLNINQVKSFYSTKKGLRNFQTLQNQDVILIQRVANDFKIIAVFDGHGQFGKSIADLCARYVKKTLKSYEQEFKREISDKQIIQILKNCLKKTQAYLHNSKYNEVQYSGTTALIVVVTPKSIVSLNIGNARLVMGMKQQNGQNIYDFQVTHDQDLNRLDERLRVLKHGSIIAPLKDELGQSYGPDRLWCQNHKRPGTFITRTLGLTCGIKAGIISDPEVSVLQYNKRMKFLVVATDGLWGVQQNDEVISYLTRYYHQGQLGMGVQSLIEQASKRWKSKTQLMDDISIIAATLTQQSH